MTIDENDTNTVITNAMLLTDDLDQSADDLTYTVTSTTTTGGIRRAGVALSANDVFRQSDIDSGLITYDHDGSETFIDSFSYTVDDGFGIVSIGTFQITINPINDMAPVIISHGGGAIANISIQENTTSVTTVLATDADLPVQTMNYQIVGGADAALFQLDSSTGELRFIQSRNYENPTDSDRDNVYEVLVRATDGMLSDTQLVRGNVLDVNEVPVANDNSYQTSFIDDLILTGSGILANDFDPDGDRLSAILVAGPIRGQLLGFSPDGTLRYRPEAGFQGTVTFSYLVTDGLLQSNVATVTVVVVLPDNVPSTPNNNSTTTNTTVTTTTPIVGPVVAAATSTEASVEQSAPQPVALVSSERVETQTQAAPVAGPELVKGELKEGVLLVSLTSGTSFDKFEVDQTRFEHFESHYDRFQDDSNGIEYRAVERRDRSDQEQSEVQFNTDSALVRTVIGSGVVLMVMQGAQLAATLMAVNPTLMQFDPLSVMAGRNDKKIGLTKGETLFDK